MESINIEVIEENCLFHNWRADNVKIANTIFTALGFVVLICGILDILNPIILNSQFTEFAVAYVQTPTIPVVAIALIAIGIGMIVKGADEIYKI